MNDFHDAVKSPIITVHRWFANKSCPGDWMYERLECLAKEVTDALTETPLDNNAADWSKNEVNWALRNGILKGDERGDLRIL